VRLSLPLSPLLSLLANERTTGSLEREAKASVVTHSFCRHSFVWRKLKGKKERTGKDERKET